MDPLIGQVLVDRFRVVRLLGVGGMGKVYEVEHTQLPKRFAIKVLGSRLAREKEALQSTTHEKILLARYREFEWERLNQIMDKIKLACVAYDEKQVRRLMKILVPEWSGYHVKTSNETTMIKQDDAASEAGRLTLH